MKRTTIPVLLVVLTLLCGFFASAAIADTGDQDGAMLVPSADRQHSDQILDLYSDSDSGSTKGGPDSYGDGVGLTDNDPLIASTASYRVEDEAQLNQLLLRLMDYFTILH